MARIETRPPKRKSRPTTPAETGPRLVVTDEQIADPDSTDIMEHNQEMVEDEKVQPEVAVELDGLNESTIVVDRDALRALRLSEAAETVATAAKGDTALNDIEIRKGGSKRVHAVNPYDLEFEVDHNPREFTSTAKRQRVLELARSIAVRGVRQPLDVYVKCGKLFVNGGETRWRATMHVLNFLNIKIEHIPIIISTGENDLDRVIDQWIGNDQLQFDPLEAGKLFRQALRFGNGIEPAEIARRIGKPTVYVTERLKLLEMPEWLKDRVRDGTIRADNAYNAIWQAAGEDDIQAKKLLAASVDMANEAGARRVMPKHIRKAGGKRTVATVAGMVNDLVTMLGRHDRADLEAALGVADTDLLYKLAKL